MAQCCLSMLSSLSLSLSLSLSPPSPNSSKTSPTDLRHFDPTLTSIPPTIADLVGTERSLHIEGFDYVSSETGSSGGGGGITRLDSTLSSSQQSSIRSRVQSPGSVENAIDESHEQHRPISEQIHNGKSAGGYTLEVSVEVNER